MSDCVSHLVALRAEKLVCPLSHRQSGTPLDELIGGADGQNHAHHNECEHLAAFT